MLIMKYRLPGMVAVTLLVAGMDSAAKAQTAQIGYPASWRTAEFTADWGLASMKAEYAYARGVTGKGVKIGIVDSGVLLGHPDLAGQVTALTNSGAYFADGYKYSPTSGVYQKGDLYSVPGSHIPGANDSHGTHVGGTMVAKRDGVGMHGVAFGATLLSSNTNGTDQYVWSANADYNYFKGAYGNLLAAGTRVINSSWGNTPPTERSSTTQELTLAYLPMALRRTFMDAIAEVGQSGIVMVFAAGNSNSTQTSANHPTPYASLPYFRPELEGGWLAAAALDPDGGLATFSNRCGVAKWWCIAAPGGDIKSTHVNGSYETWSGTSMAAPHASGAVALVMERFPYMTGEQSLQVLLTTADQLGSNSATQTPEPIAGWGKINLERAMNGPGQLFGHFVPNLGSGTADSYSNDISDIAIRNRKNEDAAELRQIGNWDLLSNYNSIISAADEEAQNAADTLNYYRENDPGSVEKAEQYLKSTLAELNAFKEGRAGFLGDKGAFMASLVARKTAVMARMGRDPLTGQTYVGSLEKRGDGKLTLAGRNTYTGSTWVRSGDLELTGSLTSDTTVDASGVGLTFVNPTTLTQEVATKGGRFIVAAGGKAAGVKVQDGGVAIVNGTAGAVVAGGGGMVAGSGTLASLQALAGSGIAPGNSIGTLSVAGPVAFAAGSTYHVEVSRDGRSDRIAATGAARLDGGVVSLSLEHAPRALTPAEGRSILGTRYTILTAQGGVSGRFEQAVPNFVFLDAALDYASDAVTVAMRRSPASFASMGGSRNQRGVGSGAEALGPGDPLYEAILVMPNAQAARTAIQQLSGDSHATAGGTQVAAASYIRSVLLARSEAAGAPSMAGLPGSGQFSAAYSNYEAASPAQTATTMSLAQAQRHGLWGQVLGSYGKTGSDGNAAGSTHRVGGFVVGADGILDNGIKLGAAAGFTETRAQATGGAQSATTASPFAALYGGYATGPLSLQLGAVYAVSSTKSRRSVNFLGFSDMLTGDAQGAVLQGYGELGYRIALNQSLGAVTLRHLEPFVGASYTRLSNDGFRERGGPAALTSFARTANLGDVTLGMKGEVSLEIGLAAPLSLRGMLGYRNAFGDVTPTSLFAFGSGPRFKSAGIPLDRHALVAETGLDLRLSQNLTLAVSYSGQYGERNREHAGKGSLTYRW